jgi:hypothetical protein
VESINQTSQLNDELNDDCITIHHEYCEPVVTCHGTAWFDNDEKTKEIIGGPIYQKDFKVKDGFGNTFTKGSNLTKNMSRLQIFEMMFPPNSFDTILTETNKQLIAKQRKQLTKGELYKFLGVMILITKFEFEKRRDLWAPIAPGKYIPAIKIGEKTGMSRDRFDHIWDCFRIGKQPDKRPNSMSPETYRWLLLDDFVNQFNLHYASYFQPSESICVDESISRWYGQGGTWINHGLPMYVAIDRKPEDGGEIQDAACGQTGIIIRIKLVKSADERTRIDEENNNSTNRNENNINENNLPHATKVIHDLVYPWFNTRRVICADSYFASFHCAQYLKKKGLKFIGVIKTATRNFPHQYLGELVFQNRGDRKVLVSYEEDGITPAYYAAVWVDRDRRYFISTADGSLPGNPYV